MSEPTTPRFGHVKLSRKMFHREHGDVLWLEKRRFSRAEAWLDLIQWARFRDRAETWKTHTVMVPRGHVLASVRTLAERWGWSKDAVVRFIAWCERDGRTAAVSETPAGTLYRLVNYDAYNAERDSESDSLPDANRDSDRTATRTIEKKGKQEEQEEDVVAARVRRLVAHANRGLADHGDLRRRQIDPIRATHPTSREAALRILEVVPLDFAEAALYERARTHTADRMVRSLGYFADAVLDEYARHCAAEDARATTPAALPYAVRPTRAPRRNAGEQQYENARAALGLDTPADPEAA